MTWIIIGFTVLVSISSFNNPELFSKLQFNAYQVYHRKEWYRLISHGFVHANWMHLFVNMFVLYMFGTGVESWLKELESNGIIKFFRLVYVLFYFSAIIIASLISLFKHKDNIWYNSVGASGATSAILFFYIFFNPWDKLYVFALLPVPGIILGILYLIYSHYMSRKNVDNINHDAHLIGAIFGFLFPLILDFKLINFFISQLLGR